MIVIPAWVLVVSVLCFPIFAVFETIWRTVDNYLRFKCENSVPPKRDTHAIGFEIPAEDE
jgi:hypothetical protein